MDKETAERLTRIESELKQVEQELSEKDAEISGIKTRLSYYDKMALKAGFFSMGFLCFGAALSMGVDKLKDRILAYFFP